MGLFGRNTGPGSTLGKQSKGMTDERRRELFYRDRERERRKLEQAQEKRLKMAARARDKHEKQERKIAQWKQETKYLKAKQALIKAKKGRRREKVLTAILKKI
jgi:hypothetical protein